MEFQEAIDYWSEEYENMLHSMVDIFSEDFEYMQTKEDYNIDVLQTDKPDFIDQKVWDNLFITSEYAIKILENRHLRGQLYFLQINGYNIGFVSRLGGLFFIFEDGPRGSYQDDRRSIESRIFNTFRESYTTDFVDNIEYKNILKSAIEYYGEENVWSGFTRLHPEYFTFDKLSYKACIIVHHEDFWVHDKYGIGIKILSPFSIFYFNNTSGELNSRIHMATAIKDSVIAENDITHPHVPPTEMRDVLNFKKLCTGDDSPINAAMNSYTSEPTEENAFNLILNHENLLSQEDEDGVPHIRMRSSIIEREQHTGQERMSYSELIEKIKNEDINYIINSRSKRMSVELKYDSIVNSIESGDSNSYILIGSDNVYTKEIKDRMHPTAIHGSFNFEGSDIQVGIISHDPSRFDFSGITDESEHWRSASKQPPTEEDITIAEAKLSGIINFNLMQQADVNKISVEEITEELIGLSRVNRNANVDNIL